MSRQISTGFRAFVAVAALTLTAVLGLTGSALAAPPGPATTTVTNTCERLELSDPSITRDQDGAYVYRAAKWFCKAPTDYKITTRLKQDGLLIREWTTTGVSAQPYHFKYEGPCYNTTKHKFQFFYQAWLTDAADGEYRSGGSNTVTLPCLLG
jgi:hypothetical protein